MAIVTVLGDHETYLYGDEGCVLVTTPPCDELLEETSGDLMNQIILAGDTDEIGWDDTYEKRDLYVAQIGIRELLNCWNEKHGTNY